MSGYKLHKYGNQIMQRNVEYNDDGESTIFSKTCTRIAKKNSIAFSPNEYRSVLYSDEVFILSIPMREDETAKIYEIVDRDAYIDSKYSGGQWRLYPISKLKLIKEIKQANVNKKLYDMSFSSYKK